MKDGQEQSGNPQQGDDYYKHLWSIVHQLSRVPPDKSAGVEAKRIHAIKNFIKDSGFSEIQKKWGIFIAGFLYADQSQSKVHYMFFGPALNLDKNTQHSYILPYLWEEMEKKKQEPANNFVDRMFLLMRDLQDPWEGSDWLQPEYFKHVPFSDLAPEENPNSREIEDTFRYAVDVEMWVRDTFGVHYCPLGEVIFYTYCWRLILALLLGTDFPGSGNDPEDREASLWKWKKWQKVDPKCETYEGRLARWLREGVVLVHPERFETVPEIKATDIEKDFKLLPKYESSPLKNNPWLTEYFNLGLLKWGPDKSFQEGKSYNVLLEYLKVFFPDYLKDMAEKDDIIGKIDVLHETVQDILDGLMGSREMIDQLKYLHMNSRFPIIPYYYFNALEPQKPKTHLVVPIWSSFSSPLTVFRKQYKRKDIKKDPKPIGFQPGACKKLESPITAVAVIGTRPLKIDWSNCEESKLSLKQKKPFKDLMGDTSELKKIKELLEKVAQPQVDTWFIDRIQKEKYAGEGDWARASSFGHEIRGLTDLIRVLSYHDDGTVTKTISNPKLFKGALGYIALWASHDKIDPKEHIDGQGPEVDYLELFQEAYLIAYAKTFGMIMGESQVREAKLVQQFGKKILLNFVLPHQRRGFGGEVGKRFKKAILAAIHNAITHAFTMPYDKGKEVDVNIIEDIPLFVYEKNLEGDGLQVELFNFFDKPESPDEKSFGKNSQKVIMKQLADIPKFFPIASIATCEPDQYPEEVKAFIDGTPFCFVDMCHHSTERTFKNDRKRLVAVSRLGLKNKKK